MLRHDVFRLFLLDDRKQDAATAAVHDKLFIEFLKNQQHIFMILLQYGIICMVELINTDIQLYYIYFQYWHILMI